MGDRKKLLGKSEEMYAHFPKYFLEDNETTNVGSVFQ